MAIGSQLSDFGQASHLSSLGLFPHLKNEEDRNGKVSSK